MKPLVRILFLAFIALSCSKSNGDQYIPVVTVQHQLDLNDPLYTKLNYNNGYVYLDYDGVKGIIVVNSGGIIYALERDCPYQPNNACAKVTVENGGITIRCGSYDASKKWVPCCNSQFKLDGTLLQGPSKYSLKRYNVVQDGTVINISN